ncbi:MAG: DUF2802 domain-containing protein [Venatoribacter sp.]
MPSFSVFEWLTLANTVVLLVLAATTVFFMLKQKAVAKRLSDALQGVQQAQTVLTKSSVGMGRHIKQMESLVQDVGAQNSNSMASIDETIYQQASRLVALGATANDLVESCGISRTEAELMVSLRKPS